MHMRYARKRHSTLYTYRVPTWGHIRCYTGYSHAHIAAACFQCTMCTSGTWALTPNILYEFGVNTRCIPRVVAEGFPRSVNSIASTKIILIIHGKDIEERRKRANSSGPGISGQHGNLAKYAPEHQPQFGTNVVHKGWTCTLNFTVIL